MKIAINLRFIIDGKMEGIGVFSNEVVNRWLKKYPEYEFFLIYDRKNEFEINKIQHVNPIFLYPPARHPFLWLIWYEWSLHRKLKKIKPDVFISMDGMLPLRTKVKTIAVIHDIAFETLPKAVPYLVRTYYKLFFPRFAKKADKVITVSEFSKKDICEKYNISPEKIEVVYNGSNEVFKPINIELKQKIRQELTEGKEFFLYTGSLHPRKNINNLLLAFDLFKEADKQNFKLVIAGRKAWQTNEMEKCFQEMKFKDDVVFTGWVEENRLAEITASAYAFTYISLFEGFGIPVLNAMYCDVPVIVSNSSSLPEVAGEAGLLVNPLNISEIAEAMLKLTLQPLLRQDLIEKGKVQRLKFSWELTSNRFKITL